jgi:16S rRNA (guanine1207-N2)-methyltransferase
MSIPKKKRSQTRPDQPHYFDAAPQARSRPRVVQLNLPDISLRLRTDSSVFSGDRVDAGTRVLIAQVPAPPARGDLLDLGCGYGVIALVTALRAPQARVWAIDVNERALELTRLNAAEAGLSNVVACLPEEVPAEVRFSAIYSNPPVRVGKAALHEMLVTWLGRLEREGSAYLVVQTHLGSDSLARWLESLGHHVKRLASKNAYRVLQVRATLPDSHAT